MRLRLQAPAPCAPREAARSDQVLPNGEALGGRSARGRDSPKQDKCRPAAYERVRAPLAWGLWPTFIWTLSSGCSAGILVSPSSAPRRPAALALQATWLLPLLRT